MNERMKSRILEFVENYAIQGKDTEPYEKVVPMEHVSKLCWIIEKELKEELRQKEQMTYKSREKKFLYGIQEFADFLNCSLSTAQRIKSSGIIDSALIKVGGGVVIDGNLALDLLKVNNNKWGNKKK